MKCIFHPLHKFLFILWISQKITGHIYLKCYAPSFITWRSIAKSFLIGTNCKNIFRELFVIWAFCKNKSHKKIFLLDGDNWFYDLKKKSFHKYVLLTTTFVFPLFYLIALDNFGGVWHISDVLSKCVKSCVEFLDSVFEKYMHLWPKTYH